MEDEESTVTAEVVAAAEAVFDPKDAATERSVVAQMDALYKRDVAMAAAFVVALVIVLPFLFFAVWSVIPGAWTRIVLAAAVLVLLIYNVTSMLYLVRNYRRDKNFIYRRDVAHLRELKVARKLQRTGVASQ